jgi:type IV pilus assembly protein PilP
MPVIKEKITAPKQHEPFRYENAGPSDPFAQSRLAGKSGAMPSGGVQPDLARRREALEGFPLDAIRMVGHMSNGQKNFALLQVDNTVYQARVGNYAGQNFGQITRVTESEVRLKELVRDAAGDWTERDTALRLQEGKMGETKK